MNIRQYAGATLAATALLLPTVTMAQTVQHTGTLTVRIQLKHGCKVKDAVLDFGTHSSLDTNIDAATKVEVRCTKNQKYLLGFDQGSFWDGGGSIRRMENGGEFVSYKLYMDNYVTEWGNNWNTDTMNGLIGTGNWQTYAVMGRVAPQATPSVGTYTDKVAIQVAY